jgi:hypothetical protein
MKPMEFTKTAQRYLQYVFTSIEETCVIVTVSVENPRRSDFAPAPIQAELKEKTGDKFTQVYCFDDPKSATLKIIAYGFNSEAMLDSILRYLSTFDELTFKRAFLPRSGKALPLINFTGTPS